MTTKELREQMSKIKAPDELDIRVSIMVSRVQIVPYVGITALTPARDVPEALTTLKAYCADSLSPSSISLDL